jgi:hypothetical protein
MDFMARVSLARACARREHRMVHQWALYRVARTLVGPVIARH